MTEEEVISMNRRLGGDASLNAPLRADAEGGGEWQDWLVDDTPDQEARLAESEELDNRRQLLQRRAWACSTSASGASSRRAASPRTRSRSRTCPTEFGVSRERVRQIEVRAFEKVQKAVKKSARELEKPRAELAAPAGA